MRLLDTLRFHRRLASSQRDDPAAIEARQESKLRRLVLHAYAHVPYYRRLFDEAGLDPRSITGLADLDRIPVTCKSDLQHQPVQHILDRRLRVDQLHALHSSGSTGSPFTVYIDARFRSIRNAVFLHALTTAGYRFGQRLQLVTTANPSRRHRPAMRWLYSSITDPAERVLRDFRTFRPSVLYGCVTPLRLLAEAVATSDAVPRRLRVVLTAAETLDRPTRALLESTFACPVYDLYGLTEMGLVGWECSLHDGFHLSDDTTLVEEVGVGGQQKLQRLVMTNLESYAMPLIRFDSGDLGKLGRAGSRCRCGRTSGVLETVEGRLVDCVRLPDGRRVSPYSLTSALETVPGIQRYRIVQTAASLFDVDLELHRFDPLPEPEFRIRQRLGEILGAEASIRVNIRDALPPLLGHKFRVVQCLLKEEPLREHPVR